MRPGVRVVDVDRPDPEVLVRGRLDDRLVRLRYAPRRDVRDPLGAGDPTAAGGGGPGPPLAGPGRVDRAARAAAPLRGDLTHAATLPCAGAVAVSGPLASTA